MMKEFNCQSGPEMTEALAGKVVKKVEILDGRSGHDKLVFHFEDGTQLVIEHDWIYEWGLLLAGQDWNEQRYVDADEET